MKRDWDLVRELLFEVERSNGARTGSSGMPDWAPEVVAYHIQLLVESGIAEGAEGCLTGLTWSGHDLLDTIRSPTIWKVAKQLVWEKGLSLSLDVVRLAVEKVSAREQRLARGQDEPLLVDQVREQR